MDLPTIKVKHKEYKYEMVINESDFDAKVHEKITEKTTSNKKAVEKAPEKSEGDEKLENTEEELKKLMEGK